MKLNRGNRRMSVGLDLAKESWEEPDDPAYRFASHVRQHYPSVDLINVHASLAQLRMIKDEDELNLMRQAQEATITAVKVMMRHCAPGINETELEGVFDFALMKQGVREHAFPTICASGANATTLHYSRNDEVIEDGSLVLCDLGLSLIHIFSLNPIMIDGTGMCGGCRVTVGGKVKFACVDGPDFDGHQVDFDELMQRNRTYMEDHRCHLEEAK